MKTNWRSYGEAPSSYKPEVVGRIGEGVRDELNDFDWPLSREELRRLRLAAYTWGRKTVKQFKKFDAQVVKAINKVIRPQPGMFRDLKIPDGVEDVDSAAKVVSGDDGFRLVGHASFAVILGYGFGGGGRALYCNDEGAERYLRALGEELARKLESAVSELGWSPKEMWEQGLEEVVDVKIYQAHR